ncbi:MAG: sugar ABC transporter permease [Clostridia bacterium]|nr:sugar ABC transporter permease [Clostridia bacterium]
MKKNAIAIEWKKDFRRNGTLYLMLLPVIAFYLLFCYKPMYGAIIAFKDYSPRLGIMESDWVGMRHFKAFLTSSDFNRVFGNTLKISFANLIFNFPVPIIFALLLNEFKDGPFKKTVQTISYMPHFISLVVICGMIKTFVGSNGIIGSLVNRVTGSTGSLLMQPDKYVPIHILSSIWQTMGWSSIIYLAALSGIDPQLYEAAEIDGAGRFKKMVKITIPSISITIVTLLIMQVGRIMSVGYEKIILLYNPLIYETSDVISSYVYRNAFETQNWGYSTAVGLFNSFINLLLLICANTVSKRITDSGLW